MEKEINKKSKSWIFIVVLLIFILIVVSYIARVALSVETEDEIMEDEVLEIDNNADDEGKLSEVNVSGYHLVTYNQTANEVSFIRNLNVTASVSNSVKFVIGSIDKDNFVNERISFELDCEKGENKFDLIDERYIIKSGEYLFMDIYGQDVLYQKDNASMISLVQSETEKVLGKMPMIKSDYALPFRYSLEKVNNYNVLVIGNDITTQNNGKGVGASDDKHDYYYLTQNKLKQIFDYVNIKRINGIDWEKNNQVGEDRINWLMKNVPENEAKNLDLAILQLGDNYSADDDLETGVKGIVNYLRKYSPNVEIVWVAMWNINEQRLLNLPGMCERLGINFVNISDLSTKAEYKSFFQEGKFVQNISNTTDSEINQVFYPNDKAMQIISDRIIEKLKFNF